MCSTRTSARTPSCRRMGALRRDISLSNLDVCPHTVIGVVGNEDLLAPVVQYCVGRRRLALRCETPAPARRVPAVPYARRGRAQGSPLVRPEPRRHHGIRIHRRRR